jgi:pimeloyl-ACP methyl ester carboxylesterase
MTNRAFKSSDARNSVMESYSKVLEFWHTPFTEIDIDTDFGKTHIIEAGDNKQPALVLLHGGGGNSAMWFANIAQLTKCFKVYAIDIVGEMGKSEDTRLPYESDDHSLWLAQVLQKLSLTRCNILGTSLGAALSLKFAIKFPKFVEDLILLAPPSLIKMNRAFALRGLISALFPSPFITRRFYRYITSDNAGAPPEFALDDQCVRANAQRMNTNAIPVITDEQLSELKCRTLLLLGEHDPIYCVHEAAQKFRTTVPDAVITIVKNAGHVISVEQPQLFIEAAFKFLNTPVKAAIDREQPV